MRFSSNQILEISGNLSHIDELEAALEFALKYSGYAEYMKKEKIDNGCKLLYQISKDGKYCIGWGNGSVPKGWYEYPFRFEIDIVSRIIRQHLESFSISVEEYCEGSYDKGFVMKCIKESLGDENDGIKNPFYGIVFFKPYTCFYSK